MRSGSSAWQCPGLSRVHTYAGSNVATTLCLIRFAFVMNLLLLLLWLLLVVLPFWVKPPVTFRWSQLTAYSAKSVIQGHGLDNTFFLYGVIASHSAFHAVVNMLHAPHGDHVLVSWSEHGLQVDTTTFTAAGGTATLRLVSQSAGSPSQRTLASL